MRIFTTLILAQLLITINGIAQIRNHFTDSLKLPFERIDHDMRIPCQFEVKFNRRENGKPFFSTKDSAQLEFDFFKLSIIPINNPKVTILETEESFYKSILQRNDTLNVVGLVKINESKGDPYFIYKVQDNSGEFYQLVAREGDLLFSIKIFGNNLSMENQMAKLNTLYLCNKN